MGQTLTLAGPPPTKMELESLPDTLRPVLTREGLTKEEQSEWGSMETFAGTAGVSWGDAGIYLCTPDAGLGGR